MRLLPDNGSYLRHFTVDDPRVAELKAIVGVDGCDVDDANIDATIGLPDGTHVNFTLITPKNITTLLARWSVTGECGGGAFLRIKDMVVVPALTEEAIVRAVRAILDEGLDDEFG